MKRVIVLSLTVVTTLLLTSPAPVSAHVTGCLASEEAKVVVYDDPNQGGASRNVCVDIPDPFTTFIDPSFTNDNPGDDVANFNDRTSSVTLINSGAVNTIGVQFAWDDNMGGFLFCEKVQAGEHDHFNPGGFDNNQWSAVKVSSEAVFIQNNCPNNF